MTTAASLKIGVEYPEVDNRPLDIPIADLYLVRPALYLANYGIKHGCSKLYGDIQRIKVINPDSTVIADAKVCDIGSTMEQYARHYYDIMGFDGVTINPYGGMETLKPFLKYTDKQVYVWLRSHGPGAADFQDKLASSKGSPSWEPLYVKVARRCMTLADTSNLGFMVGCGNSDTYDPIREIARFKRPMILTGFGSRKPTDHELVGLFDCPAVLILAGR